MKRRGGLLVALAFGLAACSALRSTAATVVPGVRLTLTMGAAPGFQLTQTAQRIPTPYVPRPPATATLPRNVLTPTLTRTARPTLAMANWSVAAAPLDFGTDISYAQFASWSDVHHVKVRGGCCLDLLANAFTGAVVTPTPIYLGNGVDHRRYSPAPNETHALECMGSITQLIEWPGKNLIAQTRIAHARCDASSWSTDSSKVAFGTDDGDLYAWQFGNSEPRLLARGRYAWAVRWSPSAARLLIVTGSVLHNADGASVFVLDPATGAELGGAIEIDGGNQWYPNYVQWASEDIVANYRFGLQWYHYAYYDADTKRAIAHAYLDNYSSQGEWRSPSKRWFALDSYISDAAYRLLDFQARTAFRLNESPENHLQFLGWTKDSSDFYVVSRPANETAKRTANVPFGLLALNPATREFTQLFEQAMFAALSPDQRLAWVVFPARRDDGSLGLDGGIFDIGAKTLAGRSFVGDALLYANPGEGDLVPAAWSNDGARLVYADSRGMLTLVNQDGSSKVLATGLPPGGEGWPREYHFAWSPDDAHLFVQAGQWAWIVTVPAP